MDSKLGGLIVQAGISPSQVEQLIHYSNTDPQVIKFTSDKKRFKNRHAYGEWKKKGRTIYTLSDKNGDLMGIIWFGEEPIPQKEFTLKFNPRDFGITFAIRIYGKARGKGLAIKFMKAAFSDFGKSGIWLETHKNNISAIKAYERFVFKQVTVPDEKGRILMIY